MNVKRTLAAAIAAIAVVICAAIIMAVGDEKAGSATYAYEVGTYQLVPWPEPRGVAWRINTSTGEVKWCKLNECINIPTGD